MEKRIEICLITLAFVLHTAPAFSQQISVDINTAKLKWTAPVICKTFPNVPPGCGGTAASYHVKCGDTTGTYNHPVVDVAAPNTEIELKLIVPTLGVYFCAVSAENQFGVSGDSNEVNFTAGATPGSPINLSVVAQ